MSDDLSLDDILIMYVQESKEHLENIENDLLAIERDGLDSDDESINKMFRAAHSIKGGSGFWGLDTIKNLSHKTENVLDLIRKRRMEPDPDVVSIILRAFDRLGELLDDVEKSNTMDISAEVSALEKLTSSNLPEGEKKSVTEIVTLSHPDVPVTFQVSEFDVRKARQNGSNLYILEFDLLKDVHRRKKTPLDFLKALNENGGIVDIIYDLTVIGDLDSDRIFSHFPLFVLFSTVVEPDLIGKLVGLESKNVHIVSNEEGKGEPAESVPAAIAPPVKATETEPSPKPEENPRQTTQPARTPAKSLHLQSDFLRVQVPVLDQLINRAGELVLARNQLLQAFGKWDKASLKAACQRIDVVTSELQESIMLTRMQPVNNIFSKFPRMIRDLSRQLGKEIDLEVEGKDVEVDKTIIEGLGDPLTHLVRNSVDHGIELPEIRKKNGKPEKGIIKLKAFHESGQIIIEISDDGKGMDGDTIAAKALEKGLINAEYMKSLSSDKEKLNLIMLPGFSTSEFVTDISGRGVGMDVVKTNLDKMGGHLEFDSRPGKGVTVRVKLPLTLAIIPSLLVSSSGERFALPQINVGELLRIPAAEVREKIKKVSGADVLILRGELIPLLQLNNLLELQSIYFDPKTAEFRPDRRAQLSDERLPQKDGPLEDQVQTASISSLVPEDRRNHPRSDVNIVVLQAGFLRYALVVDDVHDTVEIVVKPLGRHLNQCAYYAGATIMGDGRVALILDVPGLAQLANLREITDQTRARALDTEEKKEATDEVNQSLLLFHNGPGEYCGVPLEQVLRVEQIRVDSIEIKSNQKVVRYRGGILPVFALEEVADVEKIAQCEELVVVIFEVAGREVGLLAVPPLDVVEKHITIDEKTLRQPGIAGSTIINNKTTMIVDIVEFVRTVSSSWFDTDAPAAKLSEKSGIQSKGTVLLVEDSLFFRTQVKKFVQDEGYTVLEAEDGQEALELLMDSAAKIDMVVTDVEMPRMDGFSLIERMKKDERLTGMPVIVLTTLAEEADVERGTKLGVSAYHIKLDRENLMKNIDSIFENKDRKDS